MKVARSIAIARHESRIARRDYFTVITLILFPLVMMVLTKKLYEPALAKEGVRNPSGAEQAVPGMALTFAMLFVSTFCYTFFREQAWNTWNRLRCGPVTLLEVVVGKATPILCLLLLQLAIVFAGGAVLTGLRVRGPWFLLGTVGATFDVFVVAVGLLVTSFSANFLQASTISYLIVLVISLEAGALVPPSILPGWAQALAPLTPGYWAMDAYREVISGRAASVGPSISRLLIFAVLLLILALSRMRLRWNQVGF
jgi:ABC-2 type transport system permease protein